MLDVLIRLVALAAGVLLVPVLLAFALRDWYSNYRCQLSSWRNGLGLTSLTIVVFAWGWLSVSIAGLLLNPRSMQGNPFAHLSFINDWAWTWIQVMVLGPSTVAATLFAVAMKGRPRIQIAVASLLVLAAWASTGYT